MPCCTCPIELPIGLRPARSACELRKLCPTVGSEEGAIDSPKVETGPLCETPASLEVGLPRLKPGAASHIRQFLTSNQRGVRSAVHHRIMIRSVGGQDRAANPLLHSMKGHERSQGTYVVMVAQRGLDLGLDFGPTIPVEVTGAASALPPHDEAHVGVLRILLSEGFDTRIVINRVAGSPGCDPTLAYHRTMVAPRNQRRISPVRCSRGSCSRGADLYGRPTDESGVSGAHYVPGSQDGRLSSLPTKRVGRDMPLAESCKHLRMPTPAVPHLSDSIIVGQLQTYLDHATVLSPSSPSRSSLKELRSQNFDQAPVVDGGVPIGYVLARDLENTRGSVEAHVRPILPHALASETSTLDEALSWLAVSGFLFVLHGHAISGFVVPSDINRQSGRAYFFLTLTDLELELAEAVRSVHRSRDVLEALPAPAARAVRRRMAERVKANVEADVVAEMTLSQLFHVIGTEADMLSRLGFKSNEQWRASWEPINDLRRRIAHPTKPLLESYVELEWLIHAASEARRIASELETDI